MEQKTISHNSIKRAKLSGGVFSLLLLLTLTSGTDSRHARAADGATQLNRKQAVALHHAVKTLLGFKDSPKKMEEGTGSHLGGGSHLGRKSNSLKAPPQYMLDLYDKYKFRAIAHGRQTGNTARYINGEIGLVNGERMFLFNLTSVGRTERVFSAELHLHQRRTKSKNSEQLMMLHKVAPPHITEVGSVHMTSRHNGWTETDVTSGVKKCINYDHRRAGADLLAVSFRRKRNGKKSRVIPLARFSDETTMPFLVLFSNDTQNITLDHVDPHFRAADLMEEIIDPEFGYDPTLVNGYYQPKKVPEDDDYEYPEDYSDEDEEESLEDEDDVEILSFDGFNEDGHHQEANRNPSSNEPPKSATPTPTALSPKTLEQQRRRRSILDNEIPEDPVQNVHPKLPYNVPQPDSGISSFPNKATSSITPHHKVKERGKGKGKVIYSSDLEIRPHKNRLTLDRKHHKKTTDEDDDLIPYPDDFLDRRRKNRRRNRRRNRKNRRGQRPHDEERQLPFPPAWEAEMKKESLRRRGSEKSAICGRRKLVVDFADIAWDDWVISPTSFDAYYCAGQCPFPLTKDVRPSNHATIQSLVHAIGLPADVPAPCCVPDELSSLSLLYFDGNDNVVLKHYPSMSVTSCACR